MLPFGLDRQKPRHYREMLRIVWENRDQLPYAWRVLSQGVCDGCALGTTGLKDWTLDGPHLCMVRLELLRLNTAPALNPAVLADVTEAAKSPDVRDEIEKAGGSDALPKLSEENLGKLEQAVERLDVEVNVDDEGYPRRVFAELDFKVPEDVRKKERVAFEGGTVTFELVLEQIGAEVDVTAPAGVRPLSDLFGFAGLIFGIEEPADIWRAP